MSETEKNKTTAETALGTPKKKGVKLIIIVLALVLLSGAGGGFYYWRSVTVSAAESADAKDEKRSDKKSRDHEDEESSDEADGEKSTKKPAKSVASASLKNALPDDEEVKHIIELQPFIVNLADSDQARYLRLTVNLGIGGDEGGGGGHEKPDQLFLTRIRNAMLAVLTVKNSADVLNVEGKAKLRKELLKAAQAASEHPHVEAIYITDFIVQL